MHFICNFNWNNTNNLNNKTPNKKKTSNGTAKKNNKLQSTPVTGNILLFFSLVADGADEKWQSNGK